VINSILGLISHRLTTIHLWLRDRRRRTTTVPKTLKDVLQPSCSASKRSKAWNILTWTLKRCCTRYRTAC